MTKDKVARTSTMMAAMLGLGGAMAGETATNERTVKYKRICSPLLRRLYEANIIPSEATREQIDSIMTEEYGQNWRKHNIVGMVSNG